MDISNLKFTDLFKPIVIGWPVAITVLSWIFMIFVFLLSVLSGTGVVDSITGEPISPIMALLGVAIGIPIIGIFQGMIISCMCYFGIIIYRKVRKL